jgi:hypothetical protein
MPKLQAVVIGAFAVLASVLGVATVRAQAPAPGGISSELDRAATTSPEEKIAYSEDSNEEIAQAVRTVEKLRESSEREGATNDTLQCLNSRLAAMKILASVARESDVRMRDALSAGETARADLEFRKIAIAVGKTRGLLAEAYTCTGEETVESGTLSLDVSEPDPFEDPFDNFDDNSLDDVVDLPGGPGPETAIL